MSAISRIVLGWIAIGGTVLLVVAAANSSTLVRGENRSCRDFADLDYALDHPSSQYFRGWMSEDFDSADIWVASCFAAQPTAQHIRRQSALVERRSSLVAQGDVKANDEALIALHAKELREQEEREQARAVAERTQEDWRRAEEARELARLRAREALAARESAARAATQAAHEECLRSAGYRRHVAGSQVIEALARQSEAERALSHEKRVEEVSETTNLSAKHQAGEALVSAQDAVSKWYAEYRQNGGDATIPTGISPTESPCH